MYSYSQLSADNPINMADSLVASAFGASACLYADVLQCDSTATTSELRKAYHRRALLFHPDKQSGGGDNAKATLCFQAVSAAYEILMDSGRRALYDATGQLNDGSHSVRSHKNDNEWTAFFESVFREVITVGHNHATYRGSDREASDVLKFYRLCKGDLDKVLTCVVCGKPQDKPRWARDIIEPTILSGQVERYCAFDQTSGMKDNDSLIDTDDDEDVKKRNRKFKRSRDDDEVDELFDTDEEAVCSKKGRTAKIHQSIGKASMSKRDKIEYRVARKQKKRMEKQVEFSNLVKKKQWSGGAGISKPCRPGSFSNDLISSLESKYSAANGDTRCQKMGKKKTSKKQHQKHSI